MTNLLVEGGEKLLGSLCDQRRIDEVHVFVAPKLTGGAASPSPIGADGIVSMNDAINLGDLTWQQVGCDLYASGRIIR